MVAKKRIKRLPLAEWWAWVERELATERAWQASMWRKWDKEINRT